MEADATATTHSAPAARPAGPAVASEEQVLREVGELLVEIIGEEYLLDLEITMDTTFNEDLGLESIEFVVLAERLLERHGERADLMALIAELDFDQIIGLSVGHVVRHVATSLAARGDQWAGSDQR